MPTKISIKKWKNDISTKFTENDNSLAVFTGKTSNLFVLNIHKNNNVPDGKLWERN